MFVMVATGALVGFVSIAAVYVLNDRRNQQLAHVQAAEAWARYTAELQACVRGNVLRVRLNNLDAQAERIPLVNCYQAIPKPSVPQPEGDTP